MRRPMPLMVDRACICCGDPFKARASDVRRGWGLYCSKTCKARHAAEKALAASGNNDPKETTDSPTACTTDP